MTGGWVVREASHTDAPACCTVVRRSIVELCQSDHHGEADALESWLANKTVANFEAWLRSRQSVALVADDPSRGILGVALLTLDGTLALLYVAPSARFQGVSTALLAAVEDAARRAGLRAVTLKTTATARRFYLRRGYAPVEDGTRLSKALASAPVA